MTAISRNHGLGTLLCGVSVLALGVLAQAQTESTQIETITVTGSRTIANAIDSPTPVTQLSTDQLQLAAPSNIPDALNKMPSFSASTNTQSYGSLKRSNNGNYLNLRSFGIIRTLILLDGRRVTATSYDGTVDTNIMPQLLVSRVDVVTGGASAVYGADAVTGVVNFVLDRKFEGLSFQGQGGISTFGDGKSYKFGIAAGTSLFSGRAHIEGSLQHYDSAGLPNTFDRDNGKLVYSELGAGTAANPFTLTKNVRLTTGAFNPLIRTGPLSGNIFTGANTLTAFHHGTTTGSANLESGGDGTYSDQRTLIAPLTQDQGFGLFTFDITPDVQAFLQGSISRSDVSSAYYGPGGFSSSTNGATVSVNNPYLSSTIQSTYTTAGLSTFNIAGRLNMPTIRNETTDTNVSLTAGLEGNISDRFHWTVHYTHGRNWEADSIPNNVNYNRVAAALDSISSGGSIVCRVSVTNPTAFPGCVPLNPFTSTSSQDPAAIAYIVQPTYFHTTNRMEDVGASIDGEVYQLPAGPLKVALTGEWRQLSYQVVSTANPSLTLNCTGISVGCSTSSFVWGSGNLAATSGDESIYEVATEVNVPIIKDIFLIESLSLNAAGRYAHYSPGFSADTWKLGLEWQVYDDLRFRGTMSRDIRAPALNELYAPLANSTASFTDIHSGVSGNFTLVSGGNPNLRPEIGNAKTVGLIYTPQWLPGLNLTVDYYNIKLRNALSSLQGQAVSSQQQCEASGGTSPVCDLYVRPLPWSDHTAANYPSIVYTRLINVAQAWTNGFDTELNYQTGIGDFGQLNTRLMVAYQPVNSTLLFPGQPIFNSAGVVPQGNPNVQTGGAKWRATFNAAYSQGPWTFSVMERWRDHLKRNSNLALVYAEGSVAPMDYTDVTVNYEIGDWLGETSGYTAEYGTLFLTVENIFNKQPPLFSDTLFATAPGGMYPAVPGDSVMGRYFTLGLRTRF